MDSQFDETFPKILYEIETPIPNGKGVTPKESNAKTILKLEAKIYPIKKLPWLWNMSTQLQNKHHCKYIFYTQKKLGKNNSEFGRKHWYFTKIANNKECF